jgi:hypothetical protein
MGAGGVGDAEVRLTLASERFAPGDAIRGRVGSTPGIWAVDLVRVEASPSATLEFTAASTAPEADGAFALGVPADAPPSVTGRSCTLVWRVRARASEFPCHSDDRRTVEIACRP